MCSVPEDSSNSPASDKTLAPWSSSCEALHTLHWSVACEQKLAQYPDKFGKVGSFAAPISAGTCACTVAVSTGFEIVYMKPCEFSFFLRA